MADPAHHPTKLETGPESGPISRSEATLQARPHGGKLLLRGEGEAFLAAVEQALSIAPPTDPESVVYTDQVALIWRGRDAWLLVNESGSEAALQDIENRLRAALGTLHHALLDVNDNEVAHRLSGPAARIILAKGCAVDLHPGSFRAGRALQTMLAKAPVTIWHRGEGPIYDIFTRPSFAPYLRDWLLDAGREFSIITRDITAAD